MGSRSVHLNFGSHISIRVDEQIKITAFLQARFFSSASHFLSLVLVASHAFKSSTDEGGKSQLLLPVFGLNL